ncbi:MAG: class I adenylate-forming enzyme family protein [Bacteroidota bacterium]
MYRNAFIRKLQNAPADQIALVDGGQSISCSELLIRSRRLASALQAKGLEENQRVLIAAKPGVEFLVIIYANMMLRTKVAIIDPEMGRDNYKVKMRQFDPQWAFADYRLLLLQEHPIIRSIYFHIRKKGPYLPAHKGLQIIATGNPLPIFQRHLSMKKLLHNRLLLPLGEKEKPHDFLLTYTSGTLHAPKGVLHSFESLYNSIQLIVDLLGKPGQQRIATHLPHFMLMGVSAGIPVHLWKEESRPEERIRFLQRHKITTLFGPPKEYQDLIEYCQDKAIRLPNCLQHVLIGSAPVHATFLQRLIPFLPTHTRISCLYGMTENLLVALADGRQKAKRDAKGDWLGQIVEGTEVRIAKDGEILLRSSQLFRRYWHHSDRQAWHASGDLGFLDDEGQLVLSGRKKEMLIRRNFNLYPALYEPTIKRIRGVRDAVIVGIYDKKKADETVYLAVERNHPIEAGELMSQLRSGPYSIDTEALPDKIVFLDLPRAGRQSKIDRHRLKSQIRRQYAL